MCPISFPHFQLKWDQWRYFHWGSINSCCWSSENLEVNVLVSSWYLNTWHLRVCLIPRICGLPSYCYKAILGVVIAGFKLLICNLLWLVSVSNCVSAVLTCRVILPQLKILSKCPVKLGQFFMTLEEDLLNYSLYFKNLPQQTMLMQEGGIEFFAVSCTCWQWPTLPTYVCTVQVKVQVKIKFP